MGLNPSQIDDFVKGTLSVYDSTPYSDLSMRYRNHIARDLIFNKNRSVEVGGPSIIFNPLMTYQDNVKYDKLYGQVTTAIGNSFAQGSVNYTKISNSASYDIDEAALQPSKTQLIDYVKARLDHMERAEMDFFEEEFFSSPTDSTVDPPRLYGLTYWIQMAAAGGSVAPSLFGSNPTGFSSGRGNISTTTYSQWDNYCANFATINRTDALSKIRLLKMKTGWSTAIKSSDVIQNGTDNPRQIYTGMTNFVNMGAYCETRNDNLGSELVKYGDGFTIFGQPVQFVDVLDTLYPTRYPILGVDLDSFRFARNPTISSSTNMPPIMPSDKPTVRVIYRRRWVGMYCIDLRRNWALSI